MGALQFDNNYWEKHLSDMAKANVETRLHLVTSLIIFLALSFRQLLQFMFSSDIPAVKNKASRFMRHTPTAKDEDQRFPPSTVYNLWHARWTHSHPMLHQMIQPCAHEIALEESNRIIKDSSFQIRVKTLTIHSIRQLLQPEILVQNFRDAAPFMFGLMHTFAASPNKYRKQKASTREKTAANTEEDEEDDWNDDPNIEDNSGNGEGEEPGQDWWKDYDGFSRNPIFVRSFSQYSPV